MQNGTPYLDDIPLKGVQDLSITYDHNGAVCQIRMLIHAGHPMPEDYVEWTKERAVLENEWKEMMSKKAQELLDELT